MALVYKQNSKVRQITQNLMVELNDKIQRNLVKAVHVYPDGKVGTDFGNYDFHAVKFDETFWVIESTRKIVCNDIANFPNRFSKVPAINFTAWFSSYANSKDPEVYLNAYWNYIASLDIGENDWNDAVMFYGFIDAIVSNAEIEVELA